MDRADPPEGPCTGRRLALVHEWLLQRAGSDRVFETLVGMFPGARVYATLFDPEPFRGTPLETARVRVSPLARIPGARRRHRWLFPLMPLAVRSYNLDGVDVVISSSHAAAKGVRVRRGQLHLCYCYTPPRYLWDLEADYVSRIGAPPIRLAARLAASALRAWDRRTARSVHAFAAISEFVRERIRRIYGKDAAVIYPPCEIDEFPLVRAKGDWFVTASRFVPYKRVDLLVRVFSRRGMPLVVLGDGPDFDRLRRMAGPTVRLAGWVPDGERVRLISHARAFVFAAEEDFGIAPVEAQAAGTPVIGFAKGGLRETVVDASEGFERATGIWFHEQTERAVEEALDRFESLEGRFRPEVLRRNAERFSTDRFRRQFRSWLEDHLARFFG